MPLRETGTTQAALAPFSGSRAAASILICLASALLILTAACSRPPATSVDGKPEPPLEVTLKSSGDASKAGIHELRLTVTPDVEANDVMVTWQLDKGIVHKGDISGKRHNVKAGERLTFQAFLEIPDGEPRDVTANVVVQTPGGDIFGRSIPYHMGRRVEKKHATLGKPSVDANGEAIVEIEGAVSSER